MKIDDNRIVFSSKRFAIHAGYIGAMYQENGTVEIATGYDQYLIPETGNFDYDYDNPHLTKEERIELADYMIEMWNKFKEQ